MSIRLRLLIDIAQMMTDDHAQTDAPPENLFFSQISGKQLNEQKFSNGFAKAYVNRLI